MSRPKGSLNRKTIERLASAGGEVFAKVPLGNTDEPIEEIDKRIAKTFSVLDRLVHGVVKGTIKSLLIAGAHGCGKTHGVESVMFEAQNAGAIELDIMKGSTSAIGLYIRLFNNRHNNCVLFLDDCDTFFYDLDALNLLKAALDKGSRRIITWNKMNRTLEDMGIPTDFQFEGSVVFATNKNISQEVATGGKLAPHLLAMLRRTHFIDLGIHTKREVFVRVQQVINNTNFLEANNIKPSEIDQILDWITKHIKDLLTLSVSTVLSCHEHMLLDPIDWRMMSEVTLCRRS